MSISLLAPGMFALGVVASLVITALHFLSVRRPPAFLLPTARFVVPRDIRAVSRSARPSDVLLLLLRVLALLAAGLALAGPRVSSSSNPVAHVIVADPAWRADSARMMSVVAAGEQGAEAVRIVWSDSLRGMRGHLAAAWPLAWRAAQELLNGAARVDSVAVHIFAPAASESYNGWNAWRGSWPGRVELTLPPTVQTPSVIPEAGVRVNYAAGASGGALRDDPVRAAFALHLPSASGASAVRTVTVSRGVTADSNTNANTNAGTAVASDLAPVLVNWPQDGVPAGWTPARDTIGALTVNGVALVSSWVRSARAAEPPAAVPATQRVLARWSDGEPAITERAAAGRAGCTRDVGVAVAPASDILLSPSGRVLLAALAAPCGARAMPVPAHIVRDSGAPAALASTTALRGTLAEQRAAAPAWLPAVLLAFALLMLAIEQLLRRAGGEPAEVGAAVADNAAMRRSRPAA